MVIKREVCFTPSGQSRTLHIWLPEGYQRSDERYPVMYFFDGHNLFSDSDATYGKSWGLADFLRTWSKQIIVVGIECSHEGNNRLVEYCPYHIINDFFGDLRGTGCATLAWMVGELKPMIDREYRTYSFREATGIGGSSMGGLMSLYGAVRFNRWFSKAACLSSSILACHRELMEDVAALEMEEDTRIYLSWGTGEGGRRLEDANRRLAREIAAKPALTRVYKQENGKHNEASWEKQIPLFMNFLWLNQ